MRPRRLVAAAIALIVLVFVFVPPVPQWSSYHRLADQRTLFGVPNFWNVVTNAAFLAVLVPGARGLRSKAAFARRWERAAFAVFLAGAALTAAGSSYYHWRPTDQTLVWDRLPMTLLFMAVFALVAADRLEIRLGGLFLAALLALGAASIVWWTARNDLRLYGVVQYVPVLAIPPMLFFLPARYAGTPWLWGMCGLYGLAKALELGDRWLGSAIATGGHPWKHIAAAGALLCFTEWIVRRRARSFDNTWRASVL